MFKVVAITAPHWVAKGKFKTTRSLTSREPYSLQNALRLAAFYAKNGVESWAKSNWAKSTGRKNSIFMFEFFENQKEEYINLLKRIQPNLLLIGTMSLGFAGAVEAAKIAKSLFGDNIFIVIGGKHIIETTYFNNGKVSNNPNCTLQLMKNSKIPRVFDLVISGDGEEIIVKIGDVISDLVDGGESLQKFYDYSQELISAKGDWLVGWVDKTNNCKFIESKEKEIDYNKLPFPIEVFDIKSNFPVFQSQITGHTFSYISKGCPYNCFFCSEKSEINGKLKLLETSPERLIKQFRILKKYGEKHNISSLSAFIEDSVLLAGQYKLLDKFNNLLEIEDLKIKFGGQLTIDLLINSQMQKIIKKLSLNGLSYVFVGLETGNNDIALSMSKNTKKNNDWILKSKTVIEFLNESNINCGFSVLFGLGESQKERLSLLKQIGKWREIYNSPKVVSLNYATQHPLRNNTITMDYSKWGTSLESPYLNIFTELFGEASVNFCLPGKTLFSLNELEEIKDCYNKLGLKDQ
jgi:B12-binding domain/radical SAM domain protein